MTKFMLPFLLFPVLLSAVTYAQKPKSNDNIVVLVKYKTQPDRTKAATQALLDLLDKVRKEPNYVSIILHIDPVDNTNILLYEEWSNEAYYKTEHMNTPHLIQFMKDARNFLAGPPEITFWRKHQITATD